MYNRKIIASPTKLWSSFLSPDLLYIGLASTLGNKDYLPLPDLAKGLTLDSSRKALFEIAETTSKSVWDSAVSLVSKNPYTTAAAVVLTTAFVYRKEIEKTVENTSKVFNLTDQYCPKANRNVHYIKIQRFARNIVKPLTQLLTHIVPVYALSITQFFTDKLHEGSVTLLDLFKLSISLSRITDYVFNDRGTLDLSNGWLDRLPERPSQIESLNVDNNYIRYIPESFLEISQVRELSITNNPLERLPASFGNLSNKSILKIKLAVWINMVNASDQEKEAKKIAASRLSDCFNTNSSSLDLSDLELHTLPEVLSLLPNLTELNLNSNTFTKVPEDFGNLSEEIIRSIKLDVWVNRNNRNDQEKENKKVAVTRILDCFKNNSTSLDLSNLGLRDLPSEVNQLVHLTHINLGGNSFDYSPFDYNPFDYSPFVPDSPNDVKKICLDDKDMQVIPLFFIKSSKYNTLRLKLLIWANDKSILAHEKRDRKVAANDIMEFALNISNRLNLNGLHLTSLPDIFQYLTHLKTLPIRNNQLKSIPDSIGRLTNLKTLDINNNRLETIPEGIENLTNLSTLYINSNKLGTIPDGIWRLTNLKSLDIRSNGLGTISDGIKKLTNLSTLCIGSNGLETIPEGIENLTNLRELDISHNRFVNISDGIKKLTNLRALNISHNRFVNISDGIKKLTNLRALNISHNLLETISDEIKKLINLRELDISHNRLETISDGIKKLINLRELDISHNRFVNISDGIKKLINLRELDISHNQLESIAECIGSLFQLRTLRLESNQIQEIPESFQNLRNLQSVDLRNNRLSSLPDGFRSLTRLSSISLGNNLFEEADVIRLQGIIPRHCVCNDLSIYDPLNLGQSLSSVSLPSLLLGLRVQAVINKINIPIDWSPLKEHTEELSSFVIFLQKLPMMKDWRIPENKAKLLESIAAILNKMTVSDEFRAQCAALATDAIESCGDRVAVSLIRMAVFLDKYPDTVTKDSLKKLAIQVSRFDTLFKYAQDKADSMGNVDQMEVIMKLLKDLNEPLKLDLPVYSMLYGSFLIHGITPLDVMAAKSYVLAQEPTSCYAWLADFPATRKLYETQFEAIENKDEYDTMPLDDESDQAFDLRCNEMPGKIINDKVAFLKTVISF
jgi:Leucine-rich repeat (LRR) protein